MVRKRIFAALALAGITSFAALPAEAAADLTATYRGTVMGFSGSGYFPDVQIGDTWTAIIKFDFDVGSALTITPNSIDYRGGNCCGVSSPAVGASLSIGGGAPLALQGDAIGDLFVFNSAPGFFVRSLVSHDTGAEFTDLYLPAFFSSPIPFTDLRQANFSAATNFFSYGYFGSKDALGEMQHLDFNVTSLALASGVPEPSSWAMMLIGFGFVGFMLRRSRPVRGTSTA